MKQVNVYEFYQFATILHPLTELSAGKPLKDYFYTLMLANVWLRNLIDDKMIPMVICKYPAQKLLEEIERLFPFDHEKRKEIDLEKEVNYSDLYVIIDTVKEFEQVFAAELQNIATYFVSKKGIYETNDLIQKADEMFTESIRSKFPGKVKLDLREAGKCLAFDLSTAAGFHITRAVEGMLFEYLNILCPSQISQMKDSQRNLGFYIKLARENGGDEKVCSSLDQFRDLHRNPLIHPEAVLTIEEAQTLLGIAQSAIVSIVLEMDKRNNQTSLLTD